MYKLISVASFDDLGNKVYVRFQGDDRKDYKEFTPEFENIEKAREFANLLQKKTELYEPKGADRPS